MIFVAGTMTLKPEHVSEFQDDVAVLRPKVLTEDGCVHYSLLVEDANTGEVNVHEVWSDDDALKVHLAQPWIAEFFAKYAPKLTDMSVNVYDAGEPRDLPDMQA